MYNCYRCGKAFATTTALGGHRSHCSGNLPVRGGGTEVAPLPLHLSGATSVPTSLTEAEQTALRYRVTGKSFRGPSWGRLLAASAIGVVVAYLLYQAFENWSWQGSPKKQVSPYKLVGGLIQGLG